jgi:glucose-6-phosphate dehydrogenase assembly protein OpcA
MAASGGGYKEPGMSASQEIDRRRTNISDIRDELNRMWAAQARNGETILRATTHNLIVVSTDSAHASETTDRVIELTSARPGRVILIDVEPGTEERLDAWVSIYCRPSGDRQVCGELITLAVRGALRDAVDTTATALLAPDLPVYLWWTGELTADDRLFQRLARSIARVLVDSGAFSTGADALGMLARLTPELRLGDLSWARLTPWRRMLSRLWEAPGIADAVDDLRSMHIEYAGAKDEDRSERGLLLLGWLADRLGRILAEARSEREGGYFTRWRNAGRECEVVIASRDKQTLSPGELSAITIRAGKNSATTKTQLTNMPVTGCIETQVDTEAVESVHLANAFQPVSTSDALAEELDHGFDPLYQRAVNHAAEIVRACNTTPKRIR